MARKRSRKINVFPTENVDINKCWLVKVNDYHDFEFVIDALKDSGLDIHHEEVGCDKYYFAVFWVGKKDETVNNFINEQKESFED